MNQVITKKERAVSPELLDEIAGAFNRHDIDAILAYFAEDCVFLLSRGPEASGRQLKGKKEIGSFLRERFASLGDMKWRTLEHWTAGDRGVSEWVMTCTLPSGERMELLGCDLYRFRDGKIVKKDTYWKSRDAAL